MRFSEGIIEAMDSKSFSKVFLVYPLVVMGVAIAVVTTTLASDQAELMAKMGFSKEEIAKDSAGHKAVAVALDATGGKSDSTAARTALKEANEIVKLRTLRSLRQQADSLAREAQAQAALAKEKQREAERQAEAAVSATSKMITNDGVSAQTFANALDGRDKFVTAAQEARSEAQTKANAAQQARLAADAVIAKADADEAALVAKRLARIESHH